MKTDAMPPLLVDDESLPWLSFTPYSDRVHLKYFRLDPIRGETVLLLRAQPGAVLPRHHHSGSMLVYTIEGRWTCREQDWIAGPGSVVFVPAASERTAAAVSADQCVLVLCVIVGDVVFYDDDGQVRAIETWRTALERYQAYCERAGIVPVDIASFH